MQGFPSAFTGAVSGMASKIRGMIEDPSDDDPNARIMLANIAQWEAGLQPITQGNGAQFFINYGFVVDTGAGGPAWSVFANAVFKLLDFKQNE